MKHLLVFTILCAIQTIVWAQNTSDKVMQFCLSTTINQELLQKIKQDPEEQKKVLALRQFIGDSTQTDFNNAIYLLGQLGKANANRSLHKEYVLLLSEIALLNKNQAARSIKTMQLFERDAFTPAVKDNLWMVITFNEIARIEAIEMMGFIGGNEDVDLLKGLPSFQRLGQKEKYKILLALVRIGDSESFETYYQDISNRVIGDKVVYSILPDMIYTRNKRVFDLLLQEMNTTIPRCYSANNDSEERILCAYRIMEEIAPYILRFPVAVDKSGALEGDYEQALEAVRQWMQNNQLEYSINMDKF